MASKWIRNRHLRQPQIFGDSSPWDRYGQMVGFRIRWPHVHASAIIIGASFGFGAWYCLFSEYRAQKVIVLDKIESVGGKSEYAVDPAFLIELATSAGFAKKIADKIGVSNLTVLLPSIAQGGQHKLNVRSFAAGSALEFRIYAQTKELAFEVMEAVAKEITSVEHERSTAIQEFVRQEIDDLQSGLSKIRMAGETPITFQNERSRLDRLLFELKQSEIATSSKSGLAVDTFVSSPPSPVLHISLGTIAMVCLSTLMHWHFGLYLMAGEAWTRLLRRLPSDTKIETV